MSKREQFVSPARKPRPAFPSAAAVLVVAALVFVAAVVYATRGRADLSAPELTTGGDISVALSEVADGQAHFFRYLTASGKEIRFFVMKSGDGVTRAAFDSCDVCYRERRGYRQSGDSMICNNCGQAFRSTDINEVRGGCNPAPLDRAIEGDRIVLRAAALEQGAFYF